jgi:hypothetical protein
LLSLAKEVGEEQDRDGREYIAGGVKDFLISLLNNKCGVYLQNRFACPIYCKLNNAPLNQGSPE